jgi:hypothetical protein
MQKTRSSHTSSRSAWSVLPGGHVNVPFAADLAHSARTRHEADPPRDVQLAVPAGPRGPRRCRRGRNATSRHRDHPVGPRRRAPRPRLADGAVQDDSVHRARGRCRAAGLERRTSLLASRRTGWRSRRSSNRRAVELASPGTRARRYWRTSRSWIRVDRAIRSSPARRQRACYLTVPSANGSTEQVGVGAGACTFSEGCIHGTHVAGIVAGLGRRIRNARGANIIAIQALAVLCAGVAPHARRGRRTSSPLLPSNAFS